MSLSPLQIFLSVLYHNLSNHFAPSLLNFSHLFHLSSSFTISSVAKCCCSFFWAPKSFSPSHFHSKKLPSAIWPLFFSVLLSYSILPRLYDCSLLTDLFFINFIFSSLISIQSHILTSVPFTDIYHYDLDACHACFLSFHTLNVLLTFLCSLTVCCSYRFVSFPGRSGWVYTLSKISLDHSCQ